MERKAYQSPALDMERFDFLDIITVSGIEQDNVDDPWAEQEEV